MQVIYPRNTTCIGIKIIWKKIREGVWIIIFHVAGMDIKLIYLISRNIQLLESKKKFRRFYVLKKHFMTYLIVFMFDVNNF
jgi:hypothetical protein